jgi:uncharacterized protein
MKTILLAAAFLAVVSAETVLNTRDVHFYSEDVSCYGKLFLPDGFSANGKAAAVVLAPGWGETEASIEKYATALAQKGIVAMAIDYRGWGKSGGYLYLAENVRYDDRLRFSQHTAKLHIRRKRLIPEDQVLDIRNAISFLQGEPGVDRARIGVWGTDMAGGHAIAAAGIDPRIKAVVAQTPIIHGNDAQRKLSLPKADQQVLMIKLAREGQAPATPTAAAAMSAEETRLALAEYHPFWFADQIPQTTAVLFIVAEKDAKVDNEANAVAASKKLKGANEVKAIPGSTHAMTGKTSEAATAAAEWFAKYL